MLWDLLPTILILMLLQARTFFQNENIASPFTAPNRVKRLHWVGLSEKHCFLLS
jgi:hypothetical protein